MNSPGGPPSRGRAVEASRRVYRALLRAYPEDVREMYGEEMVGCFGDLCRDELRRRGTRGLAMLWVRALPELVFTALKERNSMLARNFVRNAYLPARPIVVARWGGFLALFGGVLGTVASYFGISVSLPLSFVALLVAVVFSTLGLFGLYGTLAAPSGRPGRLAIVGAVFAAASAVSWLAQGAFVALSMVWDWAAVPILPIQAATATALGCWLAGLLLLGVAAYRTRLPGWLRVLPLAVFALVPVSVMLPGLTTLASPLVVSLPFLGTALLGWALLRSPAADIIPEATPPLSTPVDPAEAARGGVTQMVDAILRTGRGRGRGRSSEAAEEAAREKELLGALRDHGELTVAGAALETSLTVEDADVMLSALAAKGHLEVRVEDGRLLYSLWDNGVEDQHTTS